MQTHSDDKWIEWLESLSEHNFVIIDDFVPTHVYQSVLDVIELQKGAFSRAGIGSGSDFRIDESIRDE